MVDVFLKTTIGVLPDVLILPEPDSDRRGLKGSVLDALVDVYGMKARYEIDINELDEELLPVAKNKAVNKINPLK